MKNISGFLSLALIAGSLTFSHPSSAVVSVLTLNVPLALSSLAVIGLGGGVVLLDKKVVHKNISIDGLLMGGITATVGLIALDGQQGQTVSLTSIDNKLAAELNISEHEQAMYNSELEELNFIMTEVSEEISRFNKPTVREAKDVWARFENVISPESMKVLTQLSQKLNH